MSPLKGILRKTLRSVKTRFSKQSGSEVFYHGTDLISALEILRSGFFYLWESEDPETGEEIYGIFVTRHPGNAYDWALQLLYERGSNFPPAVLEIEIPEEDILEVTSDPVALVMKSSDSLLVKIKPEKVEEDGKYRPKRIELWSPLSEAEAKENLEELIIHTAQGGWMGDMTGYLYEEEEEEEPWDVTMLRNVDKRKEEVEKWWEETLEEIRRRGLSFPP